jgi:hypothetical protein
MWGYCPDKIQHHLGKCVCCHGWAYFSFPQCKSPYCVSSVTYGFLWNALLFSFSYKFL